MQQYFINDKLEENLIYKLDKEVLHHFINVLRMRKGEDFYLVDQTSTRYLCTLIDKEHCEVKKEMNYNAELPCKVTIIQGLIKKDKFEMVLLKCSELGSVRIVPLISKRSIIKLDDKIQNKLERWNKICFEACCQSKRNVVCEVKEPIKLNEISQYLGQTNLVCYEDINYKSERMFDQKYENDVTIVIGPEGGFEVDEIDYLKSLGFKPIKLGNRILRSETASLYALSVISGMVE